MSNHICGAGGTRDRSAAFRLDTPTFGLGTAAMGDQGSVGSDIFGISFRSFDIVAPIDFDTLLLSCPLAGSDERVHWMPGGSARTTGSCDLC